MNWFTGTMVYIVVWWMILFMALPFGVERDDNPAAYHSAGAPKIIRMRNKFIVTTLLAALVTACLVYYIKFYLKH